MSKYQHRIAQMLLVFVTLEFGRSYVVTSSSLLRCLAASIWLAVGACGVWMDLASEEPNIY
jgi:hypothetical protein